MLPIRNGYMLQWYDEMSFFESTRFFFYHCLHFPGGFIAFIGSWLTQLLFYPVLGSSVLIVLWLLMAWITKKVFRLPRAAFPLAFIVPMALIASIVQIDDAWLSMKTPGYMYSNTLGFLFVVIALWIYRALERRQVLALLILLITAGCYFLVGFYALLAVFIGIIFMVADSIRSKKYAGLAFAAVALISILIIPNLYYQYFTPTSVDNDYLFLKGLPDFLIEKFDLYLWIPFIVATAFLLVMAVLSALQIIPSKRWMMWTSVGLMLVCAGWNIRVDKKNEQLRATVVMLRHLEYNDWERMALVMSRIKEPPSYVMRVLYNYAILNLGGVGENLNDMKPKNVDPRHAEGFSKSAFLDIPINYYNGKFNLSYRWGMEHNVQYGKRVFYLKYMVKSALLNGEYKLAKRYNDLLLRTMFYRKWAEEMNRYIEDPSLIPTNPEFRNVLQLSQSAIE